MKTLWEYNSSANLYKRFIVIILRTMKRDRFSTFWNFQNYNSALSLLDLPVWTEMSCQNLKDNMWVHVHNIVSIKEPIKSGFYGLFLSFKSHKHCTLSHLTMVEEDLRGVPPCIISLKSGQLSTTTDVP